MQVKQLIRLEVKEEKYLNLLRCFFQIPFRVPLGFKKGGENR